MTQPTASRRRSRPDEPEKAVLVVETDVILRLAVADYLRGCGFRVIEAANAAEAKKVLQHGPQVDVLFADARLAREDGGFALAQWTRRYRPAVDVVLTGSPANKSEAAAKLCSDHHDEPPPPAQLHRRILDLRSKRLRSTIGARRPRALGGG